MRKHLNWRYGYVYREEYIGLCARCAEVLPYARMTTSGAFYSWGRYLDYATYDLVYGPRATPT